MSDTWKDTRRRSSSRLTDVHVAAGIRFWRLSEWRAIADVYARGYRARERATLEAQGVRTLERAVEIPGLRPGTTRVVVALFRDGDEAMASETGRKHRRAEEATMARPAPETARLDTIVVFPARGTDPTI